MHTPSALEACPHAEKPSKPKRQAKSTRKRFKADEAQVLWLAERVVPAGHLSREVARLVQRLDVSAAEASTSVLGQNGYSPRRMLALWVYASLVGLHEGSKLYERMKTDMALVWLSGGQRPSRSALNRFRAQQGPLFEACLEQTLAWALQEGLLKPKQLAADSVRL
jgi:transposase